MSVNTHPNYSRKRNIEEERSSARERAKRRKTSQSEAEIALQKERHRVAQSKYRAANRMMLKVKSWSARQDKKRLKQIAEDEEFLRAAEELYGGVYSLVEGITSSSAKEDE
ncbi:hypothetical protein CPC08DRAFT_769221 [Agrocybe pediades]|nr:hypothetical protein CPC08DRAFT_769221 [Agrocybe pediades]